MNTIKYIYIKLWEREIKSFTKFNIKSFNFSQYLQKDFFSFFRKSVYFIRLFYCNSSIHVFNEMPNVDVEVNDLIYTKI